MYVKIRTRKVPAQWVVMPVAALAAASVLFLAGLWWGLPDAAAIGRMGQMAEATTVYDRTDEVAFTLYTEQRMAATLDEISPELVKAIIAIEDRRFYEHGGFDLRRIVGAALADLRHMGFVQGASTITQQLAKLSFLTPDRTVRRKVQELMLAERIERAFTKQEILELYLNKVFFGDGLYGAESASRGYFNKHASELTVSEAALLAGLVKSPTRYAPTRDLDLALARRDIVLRAMLDTGAIDHDEWAKARSTEIVLQDGLGLRAPRGEYAKEEIRQELLERFGAERLYEDGLRVFTTLDWEMQAAADAAVVDGVRVVEKRRADWQAGRRRPRKSAGADEEPEAPLQAALIALDPHTGEIRAMVGGNDFNESRFNRAVQARRQPGSAFKPFVYASALEAGFTPASLIDHLDDPVPTLQGDWTPDDGHVTETALTMRAALRVSSNRAAVQMLQRVGIPETVDVARGLGIDDLPGVPSLALGAGEVTLEQMTAAYAAFANDGFVPHPYLIRRVEDLEGHVLFETEPAATKAVTSDTAFLMADMLADVINGGTGAGVRRLGFTLPAGGKTGTTNKVNDAWFIGFTPRLATGVWMGLDEPQTILPNGFASDLAVPMWTAFMKAATKDDKPAWIERPSDITTAEVCSLSGKLATEGCRSVEVLDADGQPERISTVYTEYFVDGTAPTSYCDLHPSRGLFGTFAHWFGDGESPAPPRIEIAGPPLAETVAAVSEPAPPVAPPPPPEPKKKRGFWSRLFGRRGGDDNEDRARRSR